MAYMSLWKRPNEYASKSSHHNIINDEKVKDFLSYCNIPMMDLDLVEIEKNRIENIEKINNLPIKNIITVDWWYTETFVQAGFPSSKLAVFQFWVNLLKLEDLNYIEKQAFISPEDISKIKDIQRYKLVLPIVNISYEGKSLLYSVRKAIYEFFKNNELLEVLSWFIFEDFSSNWVKEYNIEISPITQKKIDWGIKINKDFLDKDFMLKTEKWEEIFLTDVFRLHENIDESFGASWIITYLSSVIEQIFIIKLIKELLENRPSILQDTLFIRDGYLWFSWPTAKLHKTMRKLIQYLFEKQNLYLVWIEKSWAFVEHACMINSKLEVWSYIMLTNNYIYKYVSPKTIEWNEAYASTSYYSWKLIIKTFWGNMLVITIPTISSDCFLDEKMKKDWYKNIDVICNILDIVECNYYDNALLPVAITNKMISLSNKPSSEILSHFVKKSIKNE